MCARHGVHACKEISKLSIIVAFSFISEMDCDNKLFPLLVFYFCTNFRFRVNISFLESEGCFELIFKYICLPVITVMAVLHLCKSTKNHWYAITNMRRTGVSGGLSKATSSDRRWIIFWKVAILNCCCWVLSSVDRKSGQDRQDRPHHVRHCCLLLN